MSFLGRATAFRAAAFRPVISTAPRARIQTRSAHQDYGSGDGNSVAEKPQQQGKNPSERLEHPGPAAPKVAQGKSPSPNEDASNKAGSPSSSQSKDSSSGQSVKGAQPKILNENPPGEQDESVREHNEEFEQRAERAHEQVSNKDAKNDKVSKDFWAGTGGRDKDP